MPKKKSSSPGYSPRRINTREIKQRFLIVCEGEKTEPNYFKSFRVPVVVIDVEGFGENPSRLVRRAEELIEKENCDYDQVWCVFDRDDCLPEDFNNAISNAGRQGFGVAYSNEAFELWYILHFNFLNTGISRKDYSCKLDSLLKHKYKKNSETIYEELFERQPTAIKNAAKLLEYYDYKLQPPSKNNPSTTVHLLVQELNKFVS